MKYHFLRDQVNKDRLEIEYCKLELQLADILTKPLKTARFDGLKGYGNEETSKYELEGVLRLYNL